MKFLLLRSVQLLSRTVIFFLSLTKDRRYIFEHDDHDHDEHDEHEEHDEHDEHDEHEILR